MACCAGQDAVGRAMDMLDALAGLDLDSPACQQAAAAAGPASVIQQPEASPGGLQSSSPLQDCDVARSMGCTLGEGAAGASQRKEDAGAMSALQQEQSVHNPFSRALPSPDASHGDSVGAEVQHLKQVKLLSSLVNNTAGARLRRTSSTLHCAGRDVWRVDQKHLKTSICSAAGPHSARTCAAMTDMIV